jgi:octaheme c-type cytochrome (tetrathionate reductase family)
MSAATTPREQGLPFFSPGTYVLLVLAGIGMAFGLARMLTGLTPVTNLNDAYPWGLWIAIDVACGVALAAGGFTTAALVDIFGRERYKPLLRPALLTAWLGYFMVGIALQFDLGRYWNVWRPMFHWQGNSVLFEVGLCVMAYLTVLTVEMSVPVLEGLLHRAEQGGASDGLLARARRMLVFARRVVGVVLPLFIVAGVVLSCMHQSSLGALMVIAPTKIHPLWYTPWLPLLFLASAIMVGFPMVIFESLLASKSFRRPPEMDILAPLAAKVPWFIGAYALLRIGTLAVKAGELDLLARPGILIAFLAEFGAGVVLPFLMLLNRNVRRSRHWLLVAVLLVIGGVVLNRVNVFLVAYTPPVGDAIYFPSVAEIGLTIGMIAALMFLYRTVAYFFPILPAEHEAFVPREVPSRVADPGLAPRHAWAFRAVGAALLLGFVGLYAVVHGEAESGTMRSTEWGRSVRPVEIEPLPERGAGHSQRPEAYKKVYRLDNEVLAAATDFYEPVRFTHLAHDVATGGDCGVCHHRFSWDPEDRVGEDLGELHELFDVELGGPCAACHEMEEISIQSCSSCHWGPNEADDPSRLGLKGAYHRQCIGCHEEQASGVVAPTDCRSCHKRNIPDHAGLIEFAATHNPRALVADCKRCHEHVEADLLRTAHWNWSGHSAAVSGHEHRVDLGLETVVNNHFLGVGPNKAFCATCHIGLGGPDGATDLGDAGATDCLVCHDRSGTYEKLPGGGGAPDPDVDLAVVAASIGRPTREACGSCHFFSDGGPNLKHGDLEPVLADPPDDFDVHMGRYDLLCQDCHTTTEHRIAGRSLTAPAVEGRVTCERCHGAEPHGISGALGAHLDDHVRAIACETCHIPNVAKQAPTRMFVDYRKAEEYGPVPLGDYGRPVYPEDSGVERWESDVVPRYAWYDGTRQAYVIGDEIDPDGTVVLNRPHGLRRDPAARIFPFKVHEALQPYDSERNVLVIPKLWDGFFSHFDWERAIEDGMRESDLEYSGEYGFVRTVMYTGMHHEIVPSERALGCADCHEQSAVTCQRCHADAADFDLPAHAQRAYPEVEGRMDFAELGYEGDPARTGGRFYRSLGRGTPPR